MSHRKLRGITKFQICIFKDRANLHCGIDGKERLASHLLHTTNTYFVLYTNDTIVPAFSFSVAFLLQI